MFNMGPSQGIMQNRGIKSPMKEQVGQQRPSMTRPPMMRRPMMGKPTGDMPFGMGPMPNRDNGEPVSTTMPVGRPQFPFMSMPQPIQTPMEDSQLWRTYNRLQGNPTASRMLF